MCKFNIVVVDPPFSFDDKLNHSAVKRGAAANYNGTLSDKDIINLPVQDVIADDALLALWVPSSMIELGLDIMKTWEFKQKQTWVWVKIKKEPLPDYKKLIKDFIKNFGKPEDLTSCLQLAVDSFQKFDLNESLAFGMGHLFRQTHEIALIGTRGKINSMVQDHSQRSVYFDVVTKHSAKPEGLQDKLDIMFGGLPSLEMFSRRERKGWIGIGNQHPGPHFGEDIRDSLIRIAKE